MAPAKKLLFIVEGINDYDFFLNLAVTLGAECSLCESFVTAVRLGSILPMPLGGGDPLQWSRHFAGLGFAEFHLYDREADAETALRLSAMEALNQRPYCQGFVTTRRSLENYLHPAAISAAGGGELSFDEQDSVPKLLAHRWFDRMPRDGSWEELPFRRQKRRIAKAKRWLNTRAVRCMTIELLSLADPHGEVRGWFRCLAELVKF